MASSVVSVGRWATSPPSWPLPLHGGSMVAAVPCLVLLVLLVLLLVLLVLLLVLLVQLLVLLRLRRRRRRQGARRCMRRGQRLRGTWWASRSRPC